MKILVVDDDSVTLNMLKEFLEGKSFQVFLAQNADQAVDAVKTHRIPLVLSDIRMEDSDGLSLLSELKKQNSEIMMILMTGFGSMEGAIEAIQKGAFDYISKPFDLNKLLTLVNKAVDHIEGLRGSEKAPKKGEPIVPPRSLIGSSPKIVEVYKTLARATLTSSTVLIHGESGTGKELVSRAIHENSDRKSKRFVAVNCGALTESLLESELFGHVKGAFTGAQSDKKGLFEEAHGGTLFLDEVGELPLHLQVKLLRALQEQTIRRVGDENVISIDVRLISATLRNLEEDAAKGRFREDLLYRLNVVSIHLPALRDRPEDISLLVEHFLQKHGKRLGIGAKKVSPEIMKLLLQYEWRGNARELENCIERALVLSRGSEIDINSLPDQIAQRTPRQTQRSVVDEDSNLSIKQRTTALEMDLIKRALQKTGGNRTHAAKILEISHRALLYKLKEYGLSGEGSESK